MTSIAAHTHGLSLLVRINWDRLFYAATVIVALWAGSWLGAILLHG